jgi:hypothetical protein
MKSFLTAVLILATAGAAYSQTPNPFIPKATRVPAPAIVNPAPVPAVVIVLHSGAPHTYHVIIDNIMYTATGKGPKVSGIYDSLFQTEIVKGKVKSQTIILTVNHFNARPTETYTLDVAFSDQSEPTTFAPITVDGRRLLVYEVWGTPDSATYKAVAVDNATGKETHFIATAKGQPPLPKGIYDFSITPEGLLVYDALTTLWLLHIVSME